MIIASFDGVATHYCGVGEVVRNMVRVLSDIPVQANVKVSLAYVAADPTGKVFDLACFQESEALVRKTGGGLLPLSNGTPGFEEGDMWRSFPEWHYASASLATALNLRSGDHDDVILILHGTPFVFFSKFKRQLFAKKFRTFYFLHSTGLSHTFGDDDWRRERIQFEREYFSLICADPDSSIVAVGETFARHLLTDYRLNVPENCIVRNGLYLKQYEEYLGKKFTTTDLARFNINLPGDSKIIFSWGRSSIVKGFKELLDAWGAVQSRLPDHYLILQAPDNSGEEEYSHALKHLSAYLPRTILIDDFNPEIWRTILRCTNTDIVCIPSLRDTNPLTAMEAKLFSLQMNYVIVASSRSGVKDSFLDDECFWTDPSDGVAFPETILGASKADERRRRQMAFSNRNSLTRYDYSVIFRKFLSDLGCTQIDKHDLQ